MIAVMVPVQKAPKAISDGLSNKLFHLLSGVVFYLFFDNFQAFDRAGGAIAFSFQNNFVGAMAQPVDGGRTEDPVGEGVGPFRDIQIGGDDGAFAFVAFGDDIMEVLILVGLERFKTKVIDDEQIDGGELWQTADRSRCWPVRRSAGRAFSRWW